jgi:hypothetical protein
MDPHRTGGVSGFVKTAKTGTQKIKAFKYHMGALKAAMPPCDCWKRPVVKENIHIGPRFCRFAAKRPPKSGMRAEAGSGKFLV